MTRWSEEDLARLNLRFKGALEAAPAPRPKYGNRKVRQNGQVFDSRKELADYTKFELQRIAGAIRAVVRQVSLPLPGTRRRIRIDHMVVENDGNIRWFDSKGFDNETGRLKRQQVLDAYGIKVELI